MNWHDSCNVGAMAVFRTLSIAVLGGFLLGCASADSNTHNQALVETAASDLEFVQIESKPLPRLLKLSDRIYTGAEPKLEQSFVALKELGIRTVIGVDGATPKLELAAKYGMRYVHVPIGYDGITAEQAAAFASVVQSYQGPFYFHCHHGRHRGPAAAAVALMADAHCGIEGGIAVLTAAGTSENYPGLWRDVRLYSDTSLLPVMDELPEIASVADFNSVMATLDRQWDETKLVKKAQWLPSAEHPDLDPHHTALILAQTVDNLAGIVPEQYSSEPLFVEQMQKAQSASADLEKALSKADGAAATQAFDQIRKSCKSCHLEYRDN